MAATITVQADLVYTRARITVAGATSATVTVSRIDADNNATPVRNAAPASPVGGGWFGDDYEAPFGQPVVYRLKDGASVVDSAPITMTASRAWLKSPSYPTLNLQVLLMENPKVTRKVPQGVHTVLGRADPIVVSGTRSSVSGTVRFAALTEAVSNAIADLIASGSVFLLQVPNSRFGEKWIAVGDVDEEPLSRLLSEDATRWTFPFIEVQRPLGDSTGDPTASYQSILSTFSTYADLRAAKATYLDILKGVGTPVLPPNPGAI